MCSFVFVSDERERCLFRRNGFALRLRAFGLGEQAAKAALLSSESKAVLEAGGALAKAKSTEPQSKTVAAK